jgi:hypothetical protein
MKNILTFVAIFALATIVWQSEGQSQTPFYQTLRGDINSRAGNVHSGNQVRTSFFNYGFIGRRSGRADDFGGEWPINSGHEYIGDISVMVGAEVRLPSGRIITPVTVADGPRGSNEYNPNDPNDFWGWEPLPGFLRPSSDPDSQLVAMSHQPFSWPSSWPDRQNDAIDPGWAGKWNGFFGKDQFNADQESFWYMDDSKDREFILTNEPFYPDSTDQSRGGLGLLANVRGFQWSQALAQNTIFWLYEITNIGTTNYNKSVFGVIVGTTIGGDGDTGDDNSRFELSEDITYSWDNDGSGSSGGTIFSPVDVLGYAFLESPGNQTNGVDDDGDADAFGGDILTEDFLRFKIASEGMDVITIDYNSAELTREKTTFPAAGFTFIVNKDTFIISVGDTLREIIGNGFDDNLNGLIDENPEIADGIDNNGNGLIDEDNPQIGLRFINYFTNEGLDNPLIDEARDDGIDNDGDWNPLTDDVGLDGQPDTFDEGEGDGLPTSGFRKDPLTGRPVDTGLPGEPNIDKTDIEESDQIGLTSFFLFKPFNLVRLRNDNQLWEVLTPGFLDDVLQNDDVDFIYGTGYFPLRAKQTERISLAFFFTKGSISNAGDDLNPAVKQELFRVKRTVQTIYNNDYNFAKAPRTPTVYAVAEDKKVTLYWDKVAESSFDRLSLVATGNGFDFEGYKIYRATFPSFDESGVVTNVFGSRVADVPIAQYDLVNEFQGFFPEIDEQGGTFYLGDNTGLVHTFVDSTVNNGFTYFYAVTAYDHGVLQGDETLFPAETAKFAAIKTTGEVELAQNVVQVRPEAPVAGYLSPELSSLEHVSGDGSGHVIVEVIDPLLIKDGNEYEISFNDTVRVPASNTEPMRIVTGFNVTNLTSGKVLVKNDPNLNADATIFEGVKLRILNDASREPITTLARWVDTSRAVSPPNTWGRLSFNFVQGKFYPANYRLEVTEPAAGDTNLSRQIPGFLPRPATIPTNIRIKNTSEDRYVKFDLYHVNSAGDPGKLEAGDIVVIFEPNYNNPGSYVPTNLLRLSPPSADFVDPAAGDTLILPIPSKSFLGVDKFRFKVEKAARVDNSLAKTQLENIKVVPNPYVATAIWEPRNNFSNGRGERSIHFIHLPKQCTIRIFNVRGELVDTIEHNSTLNDGTADWDLLSKDNIEVAYGIYIYHIDAPGIGQTTGKFAVIK